MKKPTTKKSTKRHLNTAELVNVQGGTIRETYVLPVHEVHDPRKD